jgi:hypothetical protein
MPRGGRLLPLSPLSLACWPATDRHAWAVARAGSDPLDDPGPAAHWRTVTADHTVLGYGHWLAWLADQGLLDPQARRMPGFRASACAAISPICAAPWLRPPSLR